MWYLDSLDRLSQERMAIQQLLVTSDWLKAAAWSLDQEMCLGIDATICAHAHDYNVRMVYPDLFPNIPTIVTPSDPQAHWSSHQYNDGALCLEWGPDTWHPGVSGAQVLESAFRLLSLENPLGDQSNPPVVAPSRHLLSLGQTLRGKFFRCYLGRNVRQYLAELPPNSKHAARFLYDIRDESALILLKQIDRSDGSVFKDDTSPDKFDHEISKTGRVFKTSILPAALDAIKTWQDMEDVLRNSGSLTQSLQSELGQEPSDAKSLFPVVLILDSNSAPHVFVIVDFESDTCYKVSLLTEGDAVSERRLPENLESVRAKAVVIVGAGSVGSKVALSLARMGISRFFIVDEDIFRPENLVRHVLDWRSVGDHKVHGLKRLLYFINPKVEVSVSALNLTGQESAKSLNLALSRIAQYDLIVDATADPQVFNLLSAASATYSRPIAWAEVFAGGIGGLIARSRPHRDPDPQTMRAAFSEFTRLHPFHGAPAAGDYTTRDESGKVLIASDADIEVIAGNFVRLVADTLVESKTSAFPYSMYLIGLTKSWVFDAPFHTIPIATDHLAQAQAIPRDETALLENKNFLADLISKAKQQPDANTPP